MSASSWRSACSSRGSCSTRRPRWRSAPVTAARPTSPRVSPSPSATRRRAAATASARSRSATSPVVERPRQGRRALLETLRLLRELPPGGNGSLRAALELADRVATQRSLVIVVSDFRGPLDWRPPLLRLAGRHTVLAVEIRDPREQELADVGELRLVDPESGRQLRVDTGDAGCGALRRGRRRRAPHARQHQLASAGVGHVALSTDGDWLRPLAAFLRRGRRVGELLRPSLLVWLLAVPVVVAGYLWFDRRRDERAGAWAQPALLQNMVDRPRRGARHLPDGAAPARRRAPARRLRAAAGDGPRQARGRDRRARRRRLRLDGRPRFQPTRLGAARRSPTTTSTSCRRGTAWP